MVAVYSVGGGGEEEEEEEDVRERRESKYSSGSIVRCESVLQNSDVVMKLFNKSTFKPDAKNYRIPLNSDKRAI